MHALELFCGSGGLAEGFRRAGLSFELAIDRDGEACESYRQNLGAQPVQLDVHDLVAMARGGWRPHALDWVVADLPGSASATPEDDAGGLPDERELLAPTCELIRLLRPRAYLIAGAPGRCAEGRIGALNKAGYCVVNAAVLDAADFGVAQHRRRAFWFGHRSGACLRWPLATHGDPDRLRSALPGIETRWPWRSSCEALSHLPQSDLGRALRLRLPLQTGSAQLAQEAQSALAPAADAALLSRFAWPWDAPAATVGRGPRITLPRRRGRAGGCAAEAVVLSERAGRALQGLPDSWSLAGRTQRARWTQLGQALPPALGHVIAESMLAQQRS